MKTIATLITTIALSAGAWAQMSPIGTWHNIDDKTGEVKAEIVVTETAGIVSGRITKLLGKDAKQDEVCSACTDDRKDKPMVGLEFIRGLKKADSDDLWEGGQILDPENGKTYTLRIRPIDGGKKLQVRGYIGPFYRTQTWVRVQ